MWSNHAVFVSDFLSRPISSKLKKEFQYFVSLLFFQNRELMMSAIFVANFTGQDAPSCDIEWEELWCCVWARRRAAELLDISPSNFEVSIFFVFAEITFRTSPEWEN